MAQHYDKWSNLAEDEDKAPPTVPQQFNVGDPAAAKRRAEQAKANGAAPNPLDDLFTLGANASVADLKEKLKHLPAGAKQQFMEGLSSPMGSQLLERAMQAKKDSSKAAPPPPAAAITAAASSDDGGAALVGQRVVLSNLQARPELNGCTGMCVQYLPSKGRCAVRLDGQGDGEGATQPLSLKPACLTRVE